MKIMKGRKKGKMENQITTNKLPKRNNKLIAIIIGIAAVCCIGIGIFASTALSGSKAKLKGTPDEVITSAIDNCLRQFKVENKNIKKKNGLEDYAAISDSEASKFDFDITLNSISGIEQADIINAYIKDAGIKGSLAASQSMEKMAGNLAFKQGTLTINALTAYKDGDEVGINVPQVFEHPYSVKLSTFLEDYENSSLFEMMGAQKVSQEEKEQINAALSGFADYFKGIMNLEQNEEYQKALRQFYIQILKNANLQQADSKQLTIGEKETECKV